MASRMSECVSRCLARRTARWVTGLSWWVAWAHHTAVEVAPVDSPASTVTAWWATRASSSSSRVVVVVNDTSVSRHSA